MESLKQVIYNSQNLLTLIVILVVVLVVVLVVRNCFVEPFAKTKKTSKKKASKKKASKKKASKKKASKKKAGKKKAGKKKANKKEQSVVNTASSLSVSESESKSETIPAQVPSIASLNCPTCATCPEYCPQVEKCPVCATCPTCPNCPKCLNCPLNKPFAYAQSNGKTYVTNKQCVRSFDSKGTKIDGNGQLYGSCDWQEYNGPMPMNPSDVQSISGVTAPTDAIKLFEGPNDIWAPIRGYPKATYRCKKPCDGINNKFEKIPIKSYGGINGWIAPLEFSISENVVFARDAGNELFYCDNTKENPCNGTWYHIIGSNANPVDINNDPTLTNFSSIAVA